MSDEKKPPVHNPEKPLPAHPIDLAAEILQPDILDKLLKAQLAEALFMIRDAGELYRNSASVLGAEGLGTFVSHAGRLIEGSAKIADCIARLNGAVPVPDEKRFVYRIEHVEGGGSGPKLENEYANRSGKTKTRRAARKR